MAPPIVPKIQDLADDIVGAFQSAFGFVVSIAPKAFLRVLAKVQAAFDVTLFKYGAWMFLQQYVETADYNETEVLGKTVRPLVALGRERDTSDPKDATATQLQVEIGILVQGGYLLAGEQFLGPGNGVTYTLDAPVAKDAALVYGSVTASADQAGGDGSGAQGNLDDDTIIVFANPTPQVARDVRVVSTLVSGADGEAEEDYRSRVTDRYQKQPEGGAPADYEFWGEEAAGIVAVYPYKGNPCEVNVYVEATPASSGSPDGIPTIAQRQAVLDALLYDATGAANQAPISDYINVYPITRTGFQVDVVGLVSANPPAVQASINSALAVKFAAYEPYIPGLSVGSRRDFISEADIVSTVAGICFASGATYSNIILRLAGLRTTFYTLGEGEKAKVAVVYT